MIAMTNTYPGKLTAYLCFHKALKKYTKVVTIMESIEFHNSCLDGVGEVKKSRTIR